MRNRIKQFFGWLFKGIKALWQIGWKKIMDFVTNIEAANELLDKLEKNDYVIIPERCQGFTKLSLLCLDVVTVSLTDSLRGLTKNTSCLTLTSLRTGCEGREDV